MAPFWQFIGTSHSICTSETKLLIFPPKPLLSVFPITVPYSSLQYHYPIQCTSSLSIALSSSVFSQPSPLVPLSNHSPHNNQTLLLKCQPDGTIPLYKPFSSFLWLRLKTKVHKTVLRNLSPWPSRLILGYCPSHSLCSCHTGLSVLWECHAPFHLRTFVHIVPNDRGPLPVLFA